MDEDSAVGIGRRQMLALAGTMSFALGNPGAGEALAAAPAGTAPPGIAPEIWPYLAPLGDAVRQIADTWHPDDPAYRAETYRQIMMNLSYSYFAYFHADAEHPDWAPLWNPVYTHQPNPDDIYLYAPIRGDLTYKVSGNRGTTAKLIFVSQYGISGMIDEAREVRGSKMVDDTDLGLKPGEDFELVFSARRPAGHTGLWAPIDPGANVLFVRYRMLDWARERDPQLSIECLDPVPLKKRLTPQEIVERITLMARFPGRQSHLFLKMQNEIKAKVGFNTFDPVRLVGLTKQVYWPAVFQLDDGEALIIETELPERRPYWNIQLNDPLYNAIEYVYRMSSLNGANAHVSGDGRFRAVIALEDPGVPNWLDPAGFKEGTIYGRWYDCSSNPTPTIKRVKLGDLRASMPNNTPRVTARQRAAELAARVRAAQRRRRW